MRIIFLLKNTAVSGGVRVVFEHANRLHNRGHEVCIIYPIVPLSISSRKWGFDFYSFKRLYGKIKNSVLNSIRPNSVKWFPLKAKLLKVPTFNERYIPQADVVIATRWETAYEVSKYHQDKGEKFYFIQHYEIWCGPENKVNATYTQLGLRNIVVSNWIKEILKEKLKAKIEVVIPNGVNLEQFYPENMKRKSDRIRILLPYRRVKWKGIEDGLAACKIAKQRYPTIQIVMFGPEPKEKISSDIEFHKMPYGEKLRKIYNSSDIFVFPSHNEGFGLPPMEAMACKCAVVATEVGGVPDYTIPGKTALVSKPKDVKAMSENIIRLIENPKERKKIAENGYDFIQDFGWDCSTDKLEKVFQNYVK
ncbi:MAG: glycosyltransferase family 4 protein [Patescibacteria group bacterium]|nr:glycosyltransferase family 4 protein [Patescibacteria group bacterium]